MTNALPAPKPWMLSALRAGWWDGNRDEDALPKAFWRPLTCDGDGRETEKANPSYLHSAKRSGRLLTN